MMDANGNRESAVAPQPNINASSTMILDEIKGEIIKKMSPMAIPTDAALLMNLADNGGVVDFWRFCSEDPQLSQLFDNLIQILLSDRIQIQKFDGNLMLIPQTDPRVLYLKKMPIADYPSKLNAASLQAAVEAWIKQQRTVDASQTHVEKVEIILRRDDGDRSTRFKGTAFVWFKTAEIARNCYLRHKIRPFRWGTVHVKVETLEEYRERRKRALETNGRDRAAAEELLTDSLHPDIPSDITEVFLQDIRQRKRTSVRIADADDEDVRIVEEARPQQNLNRAITLDEFQAMVALRTIIFPGVQWSEMSSSATAIFPLYDFVQKEDGRVRCDMELLFQGVIYRGSSGDTPYPTRKGLAGAKVAAEFDLIIRCCDGVSIFQALENARKPKSVPKKQRHPLPDRQELLYKLLPEPKRRNLASSAEDSSPEEKLRFYIDCIQQVSEREVLCEAKTLVACESLSLGYVEAGEMKVLTSTSTAVRLKIDADKLKVSLQFQRFDSEVEISNLLRCLESPISIHIDLTNQGHQYMSILISTSRNPKIWTSVGETGKRRTADYTGASNLWQDISAIQVVVDLKNEPELLSSLLPLAAAKLVEFVPRRIATRDACRDWRSWVPSSRAALTRSAIQNIPFEVLFQLASLVTTRAVSVDSVCDELLLQIRAASNLPPMLSTAYRCLIQYGRTPKHRRPNFLSVFNNANAGERHSNGNNSLPEMFWVPHVVVTPTRLICKGILPEVGNRLLRSFSNAAEKLAFLRVSFRDETGKLSKAMSMEMVNARLRPLLEEGLTVPYTGRRYKFLMFSASQLRQHKAWFVWEPIDSASRIPTADQIRSWVGQLDSIRSPSKYASRLGMVLSSSFDVFDLPKAQFGLVPDIKSDGAVFSDGIGALSAPLASKISKAMKLSYIPSCFQIRYGGVKGILSIHPPLGDKDAVRIRPSMLKFDSNHTSFEILNWSSPQRATLNRQVILVLSSRGVTDEVFLRRQREFLEETATSEIRREVRYTTFPGRGVRKDAVVAVKKALQAGFSSQDPFLAAAIKALKSSRVSELKSSCRIPLASNEGRYLLGALDEFRILDYGQVFISVASDIDDPSSPQTIIKGKVAVSRSPCLHPGDVRVLDAVDIPKLRHLRDCVVFPQRGPRSHPSECSGGDLDGDLYLCIWARDLLPNDDIVQPAASDAPESEQGSGDRVSTSDITNFFLHYVQNDYLGALADAWMAYADHSVLGAFDPTCLQLAHAHFVAVDFAKHGKKVDSRMVKLASVRKWPDFMERDPTSSYKSDKVLGKLYRQIPLTNDDVEPYQSIVIDDDVRAMSDPVVVRRLRGLYEAYCAEIVVLAAAYGISEKTSDLSVHYQLEKDTIKALGMDDGREVVEHAESLVSALDALHLKYRDVYTKLVAESSLSPQKAAVQVAASWYMACYDAEVKDTLARVLSFAWIVVDELCAIKSAKHKAGS